MNTIDLIQKLNYLLDVFKHYNNYVLSKFLLNDEDSYDVLNAKAIIVGEIATVLSKLKTSDMDDTILDKLTEKITQTCGNIVSTSPKSILSNTYAQSILQKLEGKVIINPHSDFRIYKEYILSSLINQIDTIIISRTTDNRAYLVTVIDSKELVHNVYQLRTDAVGFEEFYKLLKNAANITVLGESIEQIIPKSNENKQVSWLKDGNTIKIPQLALNGDEKISIADIMDISTSVYQKFYSTYDKLFKNYKREVIGYSSELGKVHLTYNIQKTNLDINEFVFVFYGEIAYGLINRYYVDSGCTCSMTACYDSETDEISLHFNLPLYLYCPYNVYSESRYSFTPIEKNNPEDYTLKYHLDDLYTLFRFLEERKDFFATKTYSFGNIEIEMDNNKISIVIDTKTKIYYNVETGKYDIKSNNKNLREALKANYQSVLRDINIPVSECPQWMKPEIVGHLKPENDLSLTLGKTKKTKKVVFL